MLLDSATSSPDPLMDLAEALDAAVGFARDGAGRSGASIGDLAPAAGRLLSRAVYRASFAVSYGIVFPVALLAGAVPRRNAVVRGLIDGARASMGAVLDGKATTAVAALRSAR